MKNKRRYIKIIVVIVILSVIFLLTVGLNLIKKEQEIDLIVLDSNVIFKKQNNKWYSIKKDSELKKYNWQFLYTFVDNEYLGKYYLYFDEEWYLFDKDKNALNYNGSLIAFNDSKYKVINFNTSDIVDNTYLNKILTENNLDLNQELTNNYYFSFDIDNDNKDEQLYVVSNRFPINNLNTSTYFSFVFLVDNGKIITIYEDIEKTDDSYSGCKPYIKSILDINDDNKYEVILNCAYYSTGEINSSMYEYKHNKFKLVVSS